MQDILDRFAHNIFLNNNGNVDDINHIYICLIPKINQPKQLCDFRHNSLCNVIYMFPLQSNLLFKQNGIKITFELFPMIS